MADVFINFAGNRTDCFLPSAMSMRKDKDSHIQPVGSAIAEQIARIALPAVVSNISVPLLSLVDTAIVGHMGAEKYIGAVAVGGTVFNVVYWLFGFLRMGTSGLTAQAFGSGNAKEMALQLARPVALALFFGMVLVLLGGVAANAAFMLIGASADVEPLARAYFAVGIFGAPAVLAMYAFSGWFIGMQNSRYPMSVAILQNLVNVAASLVFVYVLRLGVAGVALGTVTAQYFGLAMCVVMWRRKYARMLPRPLAGEVFDTRGLSRFFGVNRDIFLRTLCIIAVMSYFTAAGAAMGDTVLAVNSLLMQLFIVFSYFMDGFAYAGEALAGRYVGEHNREAFSAVVRRLFYIGSFLAAMFTLSYFAGGRGFLSLLTDNKETVAAAMSYLCWAACVPAASFVAFVLDGICVGTTASRLMLLSSSLAAAVFFAVFFAFRDVAGNDALWAAFLSYLSVRGLVEVAFYSRMARRAFIVHRNIGG